MIFNSEANGKKIRVGAVSYLNTKPLVFGFEKGMMKDEIELQYNYPGYIAQALLENSIDVGLVPVAIIPLLKDPHLIADYCIASDGPVASVCLFSDVPIQNIKTVLLDYQSRTSILLVQYLLKEYWKVNPVFKEAGVDYMNQIKGDIAGLVIGDRAFKQRKISPYIFDLGEAWKNLTGLPFVYAAWVSNKPLPEHFTTAFNAANQYGLERLDQVVQENPSNDFDLHLYYTQYIKYRLNDQKRKGLNKFLHLCIQLKSPFQQPLPC